MVSWVIGIGERRLNVSGEDPPVGPATWARAEPGPPAAEHRNSNPKQAKIFGWMLKDRAFQLLLRPKTASRGMVHRLPEA